MAGATAVSTASQPALSSLSREIEAGRDRSRSGAASTAAAADRHQNGAQEGPAGDVAASYGARIADKLAVFGLDICQAFNLRWYNDAVPEESRACIPVQGAAGADTAALLVGNTKHIWEHFITACVCHQELLDLKDPLDTYIERSIEAVLQDVLPGVPCRCFFGHQQLEGGSGSYVALQRCAQAIGLAHLDAASHLCLHPKYGPWFSLRAVLVFDGVNFNGAKPAELPNPLDATTQRYISLAVASAMRGSSNDLSAALEAEGRDSSLSLQNSGYSPPNGSQRVPAPADVRSQWKRWVAIRDAPCAGHPWRYSKHQLAYHYTGERDILRRLVAFAGSPRDAPERLAVELELPSAAARRRSRERSRSNSGELGVPMGCDDATARWAAYAAAGAQGHAASGQCGLQAASGSQPGDSLRVGSFSPSRRRPPPGLDGVEEDVATDDLAEGEVQPPRLGRDSMGSNAGDTNGGLAA